MLKLTKLINIESQYLSKDNYQNLSSKKTLVAKINELNCIGCNKCTSICPVDAIIGAPRVMHTIVSNICTGCNLCVVNCPTNCIKIQEVDNTNFHYN